MVTSAQVNNLDVQQNVGRGVRFGLEFDGLLNNLDESTA